MVPKNANTSSGPHALGLTIREKNMWPFLYGVRNSLRIGRRMFTTQKDQVALARAKYRVNWVNPILIATKLCDNCVLWIKQPIDSFLYFSIITFVMSVHYTLWHALSLNKMLCPNSSPSEKHSHIIRLVRPYLFIWYLVPR
jgi:hypothetical protein